MSTKSDVHHVVLCWQAMSTKSDVHHVVDLCADDDSADSDFCFEHVDRNDFFGIRASASSSSLSSTEDEDEDFLMKHSMRRAAFSSSSLSSLASWESFEDQDEGEVVARMAREDWNVVEGMVGPTKALSNSALVKIIMPKNDDVVADELPKPSRRGGRRGTAIRKRQLLRMALEGSV